MMASSSRPNTVMGALQNHFQISKSSGTFCVRPATLFLRPASHQRTQISLRYITRRGYTLTVASYNNYGGNRPPPSSGGPNPKKSANPIKLDAKTIIDLALPTIAVVGIASLVAPFLVGFLMSAIAVGAAISALAVFFSFSSILLPFLVPAVGVPLLVGGGILAGLFAIPALIQMTVIAAGLGLGAWVTRNLLFPSDSSEAEPSNNTPNGTIDVEANTVEDWVSDLDKEAVRREKELREFDDLLRRREQFKKGGGGY